MTDKTTELLAAVAARKAIYATKLQQATEGERFSDDYSRCDLFRHAVEAFECLEADIAALATEPPRLDPETVEACAKVADNPGFIEARDTEWDAGVNYAKRYIACAIRALGGTGEGGGDG